MDRPCTPFPSAALPSSSSPIRIRLTPSTLIAFQSLRIDAQGFARKADGFLVEAERNAVVRERCRTACCSRDCRREPCSTYLLKSSFVVARKLIDARRLSAFGRVRIDRESLCDFFLRLVVLFGIDVLFGDQQMAFDEVGIRRHRLFELGRRSFGIGQRQSLWPCPDALPACWDRSSEHPDSWRSLPARCISPTSRSPQVTKASALRRIALRDDLQKVVRIVEMSQSPTSSGRRTTDHSARVSPLFR